MEEGCYADALRADGALRAVGRLAEDLGVDLGERAGLVPSPEALEDMFPGGLAAPAVNVGTDERYAVEIVTAGDPVRVEFTAPPDGDSGDEERLLAIIADYAATPEGDDRLTDEGGRFHWSDLHDIPDSVWERHDATIFREPPEPDYVLDVGAYIEVGPPSRPEFPHPYPGL